MALTPGETIRKRCVNCCGNNYANVRSCDAKSKCPFHKYRLGTGRPSVKVLRKFCLLCMCEVSKAVQDCLQTNCEMFEYRFGTSPNKQPMSEERKAKLAVLLKTGRDTQEIRRTRSIPQEIKRTRTRRD